MLLASLTNRIFLAVALLVVLAVGVTAVFVSSRVTAQAESELQRGLLASGTVVGRQGAALVETFALQARLTADLPKLKAAVATGDAPTVQPLVADYQQMLAGSSLVMVTDLGGRVLASAGPAALDPAVGAALPSVRAALAGSPASSFRRDPAGILQVLSVPITVGGEPAGLAGTLSVGFLLNDAVASDFKQLTGSEIAFGLDGRIVAATLPEPLWPLLDNARRPDRMSRVASGSDEYVLLSSPLVPTPSAGAGSHAPGVVGGSPFVVVVRSRTEQLRFLGPIKTVIAVTVIVTMLLATVLSYAVARTVTRPLAAITGVMREVAATGDLTRKIPLRSRSWQDEDTRLLASTFNTLTDSIARSEEERLRLSSAVEQTADTVFITNRDGVIEYVNPAFEATTGYSREEAIGQTPRILKSGQTSPQYYAQLWSTILAGATFRSNTLNRKKSGELYHAEQTITPVKGSDGNIIHFVAVVKDMTDRFKRQAQEIEMQYASQIQQKLYPAAAPRVEGYDIAGAVFPAKATCGDYFDYVPLAEDGLGLVIGDVCGHGLGPALIMAATRSYLRFLSNSRSNPGQIFAIINDALFADLESNHYVAMVLVRLETRSNRFSYANAGHVSGYLLDREGEVKTVLSSTGVPLGMFPSQQYGCREDLTLESGDLVVLFTDGISEAEDGAGNVFGAENALRAIRAHRHEPAEQIVQCLCRTVHDFVGAAPQQDDITVVVCKGGSRT